MGRRPHDWQPLEERDPIPGDPDQVAELGRKLRATASDLNRQIANLKAIAEVDSWDSKAGKEFRKTSEGSVGKLEAAFRRFDSAASAIGEKVQEGGSRYEDLIHENYKDYASELNRAQRIADGALKDAQEAEGRKSEARKNLDAHSGKKKVESDEGGKTKRDVEGDLSQAGDDIDAARAKVEKAKNIRNNAAKKARESVNQVISDDSLKDGFWDSSVAWLSDMTEDLAKWAGTLSLMVGWIPVIGQALAGFLGAVAMIATLVNVACTLYQVIKGDAELMDLGTAALGFLAMGVGKAFAKLSGRFVGAALKRMKRAEAAPNTSKAVRRNNKKFNKISGQDNWYQKGDFGRSMKETFTEPFSPRAWKENFNVLKSGSNYRNSWDTVVARGDGNAATGAARSFSLADSGVASQLKNVKESGHGLGQYGAVNEISRKATGMAVAGSGITLGGVMIDEVG